MVCVTAALFLDWGQKGQKDLLPNNLLPKFRHSWVEQQREKAKARQKDARQKRKR